MLAGAQEVLEKCKGGRDEEEEEEDDEEEDDEHGQRWSGAFEMEGSK